MTRKSAGARAPAKPADAAEAAEAERLAAAAAAAEAAEAEAAEAERLAAEAAAAEAAEAERLAAEAAAAEAAEAERLAAEADAAAADAGADAGDGQVIDDIADLEGIDLDGRKLRVRSIAKTGRRRIGMAFTPEPTPLLVDDLDADQIGALLGDPELVVELD